MMLTKLILNGPGIGQVVVADKTKYLWSKLSSEPQRFQILVLPYVCSALIQIIIIYLRVTIANPIEILFMAR
jgi:hypothetical protein